MDDTEHPEELQPEEAPEPPPFAPDEDLIGDLERGPDPRKMAEAKKIFPRDPGAEARRLARKQAAKKS